MRISLAFAFLGGLVLAAAPVVPVEVTGALKKLALTAELDAIRGAAAGLDLKAGAIERGNASLTIDRLHLREPDLALNIRHLQLHFAGPAAGFLKTADAADGTTPEIDQVTADGITLETGAFRVTIAHIELAGTALGKADLLAFFDTQSKTPAAARLAKINAAHVAIPTLVIERKSAADTAAANKPASAIEKISFADIALDRVIAGRAGAASIISTSATLASAESGEMQAALGPTSLTGVDLAKTAALFATSQVPNQSERLCDTIAITGVKVAAPQTKAELGIATVAIKAVTTHVPSAAAPKPQAAQPPLPAPALLPAPDSLDIGSVDFADLRFAATNGDAAWSGRIGHGLLTQMQAQNVRQAGFDDFSVTSQGAKLTIGRLGWGSPSPAPQPLSPDTAQNLTADTIDLDLGARPAPAQLPSHLHLGHFALANSALSDGVPSRVQAALDHLSFDLAEIKSGQFAALAGLGYGRLDLSSALDAHFDDRTQAFNLDALSFSGIDMGKLQMAGRFDQVTKGLFSADQAEMDSALLKVLLRHIELRLENQGLVQRYIAAAAKTAGISEGSMRETLIDRATSAVYAGLGHGPEADRIVAALAKFIAEPRTLRLAFTAPEGMGALDVIMSGDPSLLLQKMQIDAAADE